MRGIPAQWGVQGRDEVKFGERSVDPGDRIEVNLQAVPTHLAVNGSAPGNGLSLCVVGGFISRTDWSLCVELPADGAFRLLLPEGDGNGVVCRTSDVEAACGTSPQSGAVRSQPQPPLTTFAFTVEAGRTITVDP